VLGVVAPPGAIVVPEMVERVVRGPDGKDRLIYALCCARVGCIGCAHKCPYY